MFPSKSGRFSTQFSLWSDPCGVAARPQSPGCPFRLLHAGPGVDAGWAHQPGRLEIHSARGRKRPAALGGQVVQHRLFGQYAAWWNRKWHENGTENLGKASQNGGMGRLSFVFPKVKAIWPIYHFAVWLCVATGSCEPVAYLVITRDSLFAVIHCRSRKGNQSMKVWT